MDAGSTLRVQRAKLHAAARSAVGLAVSVQSLPDKVAVLCPLGHSLSGGLFFAPIFPAHFPPEARFEGTRRRDFSIPAKVRTCRPCSDVPLVDQREQLVERHRLHQMLVEAGLVRPAPILRLSVAAHRDQLRAPELRVFTQRAGDCVTV